MTPNEHERLIELSKKRLWLPFTQMKDYDRDPLVIERGEGVYIWDTKGNRYYDAFSSVWLNVHGHRKAQIDDAIREQLEKIAHSTLLGMTNVPATELADKLVSIAPEGLTRVFYSDSGAEAVEIALKIAFQYWQNIGRPEKQKFVTMRGGYHGDTIGAVSVGNIDIYHKVYRPLLFESYKVPYPYVYRHPSGDTEECMNDCLRQLEELLAQHAHEIAALTVESMIQGANGMLIMPKRFYKAVEQLCRKYDVLLIADEVATGFGRTGPMFACEHEHVTPDIMTVAKGITGGYLPIAATLTSERLFEAFYADYTELKTLFHGHSYTGNQLGCAAALANLRLFEEENVIQSVKEKSEWLKSQLESFYEMTHVGDIRQLGFMAGIELVKNRSTKEPFEWATRTGYRTTLRMRQLGMLTRPLGDVLVFMPPLASTKEELSAMLQIMKQAVIEITESK